MVLVDGRAVVGGAKAIWGFVIRMFDRFVWRRLAIALVLCVLASSCAAGGVPKSVVLLIGDGMGVGHVTAARCAAHGPDGRLAMDMMPVTGLLLTHAANTLVTDSAAAGTALAAGVKTNNGMISMTPDGVRLRSILDVGRDIGKSTGIISTKAITDATPAVYVSNVTNRGMQEDIAAQMVARRVNVIMGGGRNLFVPKSAGGGRSDERNLLDDARKRGYDVIDTAEAMNSTTADRVIGLFTPGNLTSDRPEPTIAEMTTKAISILSANPKGFFLMSEGGKIDSGGHANDDKTVVKETLMFDDAVRAAVDFAKADGNTLVVVTADHDTGGMAVLSANAENPTHRAGWVTGGHTGNMVPVYAYGPGAERFSGTYDNTRIPQLIAELWKQKLN